MFLGRRATTELLDFADVLPRKKTKVSLKFLFESTTRN
jgi:hypothetical protein